MCSPNAPLVALLAMLWAFSVDSLWAQTPPPGPPPGRIVDVGGLALHVRMVGPDTGPTVILEAGAGGYSSDWSKLQDTLAASVRTFAYDRAGSGWSQRGPGPRTMQQEVFELRELLKTADVPGPYIVVGHSYGGLLARLFAEQSDSDVVGVVLVDATHESAVLFQLQGGAGRWVRIREQATGRAIPEPRKWVAGEAAKAGNDPGPPLWAEELERMHQARLANPTPLGERPLIVLAGTRESRPPGVSDEDWKKLRDEKDLQRAELALLSRKSLLVRDPVSGHHIHHDNPELVARAVERVLEAATKDAPLMP